MSFAPMQLLQINKQVDKILNTPGNFKKDGHQLEMTFVLDDFSHISFLKEGAASIASSLKSHDQVFRNVRCNVVHWKEDNSFSNQVMPMSFIQMGKIETEDSGIFLSEETGKERQVEELYLYLKKYHARSKVIIFLTDREYEILDKDRAIEGLTPFLKMKLLTVGANDIVTGAKMYANVL